MRKRYKEGRNNALEQIINKQQQQIDLLENKVIKLKNMPKLKAAQIFISQSMNLQMGIEYMKLSR